MHNHDNPQDPDASSDTHDSGPATFHAFMEERLGDVMSFRNSLADETDRGVALMSAAYLEDRLGVLFGRHFVQNEKVIKEMIGQNRPLGTFSARISLAYLLGLIGPKIYRDLELIRRIRNQFAHEPKALAFDAPEIRSRSLELHTHTFETGAAPREVPLGLSWAFWLP